MALSSTAVPRYYGKFRNAIIRGEIPVNLEISLQINRIDYLIRCIFCHCKGEARGNPFPFSVLYGLPKYSIPDAVEERVQRSRSSGGIRTPGQQADPRGSAFRSV